MTEITTAWFDSAGTSRRVTRSVSFHCSACGWSVELFVGETVPCPGCAKWTFELKEGDDGQLKMTYRMTDSPPKE